MSKDKGLKELYKDTLYGKYKSYDSFVLNVLVQEIAKLESTNDVSDFKTTLTNVELETSTYRLYYYLKSFVQVQKRSLLAHRYDSLSQLNFL